MMEEELNPELVPYLVEYAGITWLKHPMVNTPVPINGHVNRLYAQKLEAVTRAESAGDYGTALWFYEKPWRIDKVLEWDNDGLLTPELYQELLGEAWTDTELPHQHGKLRIVRAFKKAGFITDTNMPPPEHALTVFRGGTSTGLSWTLSLDKAVWFAQRFGNKPLWRATIKPEGVLAVFHERGESEVVVNYRMLKDRAELNLEEPA